MSCNSHKVTLGEYERIYDFQFSLKKISEKNGMYQSVFCTVFYGELANFSL